VRKTIRVCLWTQAAILLGVATYVLWARFVRGNNEWQQAIVFATALVCPFIFYILLVPKYLRVIQEDTGSEVHRTVPVVWRPVLAVALYLPLMILMASDPSQWSPLVPLLCFFAFLLFGACFYQWLQIGSVNRARDQRASGESPNRRQRLIGRILSPQVILLVGVMILGFSCFERKAGISVLNGHETWITAEFGLGERINIATLILNLLGRVVYGGSLLIGLGTLICLGVFRLSTERLKSSGVPVGFGLATCILAIASLTDYYFSWLSFLLEHEPATLNWILFCLLLVHWVVPLLIAGLLMTSRRDKEEGQTALLSLMLLYAPLLLFDLAMTPFFTGDWWFHFILTSFLGLQLLAWGYLSLAFGLGVSKTPDVCNSDDQYAHFSA